MNNHVVYMGEMKNSNQILFENHQERPDTYGRRIK
jgi:hypothetical protein